MDLSSILSAVERMEISAKLALETAKEIRASLEDQKNDGAKNKGLTRSQRETIVTKRLKRIKRK